MALNAAPSKGLIRPAQKADIPYLIALEESSFATDRLSPRQWRYHIQNPKAYVAVYVPAATADAVPLACAVMFLPARRAARLYSLAVDSSLRGQGVGGFLLADASAMAQKRGYKRLILEVNVKNEGAIALYLKNGYVPIQTLECYYADGTDGIRMSKPLERGRR